MPYQACRVPAKQLLRLDRVEKNKRFLVLRPILMCLFTFAQHHASMHLDQYTDVYSPSLIDAILA